jgi:hypothetical protein
MSPAFEMAPASERTLAAGDYLAGVLELAVIAGAVAFAAWRIRAAILPAWTGAPARLVESVIAIASLILLAELFGTFGAFGDVSMVLGSLALAAIAWWLSGRFGPAATGEGAPPAPSASRVAIWLAAGACAAVAAAWMVPTLAALAGGMDRADSLWYHMPQAARFAEGGDLSRIDYFDPIFFASYYPANSEVLHAIPLLAFGRDILSPLLNLGFLAMGLLAAYCIGRPYGVGPQSMIGGAIALGAQNLVEFQAGEALNDIVGVAFVLSAVAVLVNAWASAAARPRNWAAIAVAGAAAGLAAGTKLSFLAPVIALAVGVAWIAKGARVRTFAWFAIPAFLTGGYWFLRNLFAVGNPIPYTAFGPLGLPTPERTFELRPGFSVFHYATDTDVWSSFFFPGLDESFGLLWPLTLAAFIGGAVYAICRGGEPLVRVLGAVVLFTTVAYVFTPLTAAGEEGEPIAFVWNVRYLAPAAALGLALLPCLPALRRSERARRITLDVLAVLFVFTIAGLVQWQQGHVKGAVAAGIAVLGAFVVIRLALDRGYVVRLALPAVAGVAAAVGALAIAGGWWEQNHYLERRYENLSPTLKLADAVRWARDVRGAKIAVAGVRGVFNQYPVYGTDLSNEVQWLGEKGPDGAYERIPTCAEWRQALADGGYTHVVTTYDPYRPGSLTDTKESLWTRRDPAAKPVVRDGPVAVYELDGTPDPAGCDGLPDLSPDELDGDSVNNDPTANQP